MQFKRIAVVLVVLSMVSPATAEAGLFRRRQCRQPVKCVAPVYRSVYQSTATYRTTTTVQASGDMAGALGLVNAERARWGRGPLAWSAELAYEASQNHSIHGRLAAGATQCQAWCRDPVTAVRDWIASPAHHSNLVNATGQIGISADNAGGFTANQR
jgi:uncharacterized protein YkwD